MLTANWFVTWKCNYHCRYCWQESAHDLYRLGKVHWRAAEEWAKAWNRVLPDELELTGGEPSLYPCLVDFITLLNPEIKVTMTTHLGKPFPILDFVKRIKPVSLGGNFYKIALSFHPTQTTFDEFAPRAALLKNNGFDIQVNYVLYPEQMWMVADYQKRFEELGLELHIEPYVAPSPAEGGLSYQFNRPELEWINYWVSGEASRKNADRRGQQQFIPGKVNIEDEQTQKEYHLDRRPVFCPAGGMRLSVDEIGNAYVCMRALTSAKLFGQDAMPYYRPIGNILSSNFKLMDQPVLCWEHFRCSGCDYDKVKEYWKYPRIPEELWVKIPE